VLGTTPPTLFVVFAEPPADGEEAFHHWYDVVHGPDAIQNGSFTALNRYRAVGPGWRQARFLALWEGQFTSENEAWDYIAPRAKQLQEAGRVGDVAAVVWARMMLASAGSLRTKGEPEAGPRRSLTTVQNDWRSPDPAVSAEAWWMATGLDDAPKASGAYLYSSDPDGRGGAGYHLAVFEHEGPASDIGGEWARFGAPGTSPTPPYQAVFVDAHSPASAPGGDQPPPAPAWVMHWEPVSRLG
jgi:hypothetical protein